MGRMMTWGPVVLTLAAGAAMTAAAQPKSPPPLPVPPVARSAMPPFLARITMSGDPKMQGVFESCMDPAAAGRSARERAKARPAGAPPPLTGCVTSQAMRPGGAIHHELSCDRAKGAKASFRLVSDGTPSDLRMHVERDDVAGATGGRKTMVIDSHVVRLGPCPADLKPGQMRRPGGPVLEKTQAARVLQGARGAAP